MNKQIKHLLHMLKDAGMETMYLKEQRYSLATDKVTEVHYFHDLTKGEGENEFEANTEAEAINILTKTLAEMRVHNINKSKGALEELIEMGEIRRLR